MARAVYLTSLEPESGKSLVALGLMEILSRRVDRVGYFRPVVPPGSRRDETVELFRTRYRLSQSYGESYGVTADRTRTSGTGTGGHDAGTAVVDEVLSRFESLARGCDVVVVEGTDYLGASAAFQVDLNARMAANLGAGVVVVAAARERRPEQVRDALQAALATFAGHGSPVVANVINRVPQDLLESFQAACRDSEVPTWVLPEIPGLDRPTLGEIATALDAEVLVGDPDRLTREVAATRVAAMTVSHVLDYLQPDSLVVVPGDRADVILACLTTRFTKAFPAPAGLLLTGGMRPDPQVLRFAEGLDQPITPMLLVGEDTYATASALADIHPQITAGAERKIALALGTLRPPRRHRCHRPPARGRRVHSPHPADVRAPAARASEGGPPPHRAAGRGRRPGPAGGRTTAATRHRRADHPRRPDSGDRPGAGPGPRPLGCRHPRPPDRGAQAHARPELFTLRGSKGLALDAAYDLLSDVSYFGTMMVHLGLVDGMVSGATHTTADTVRPALQIIRTDPDTSIVSSVFFMALPDRVLVYGDCAINPDPDAEQLATIAVSSARTAAAFGIEPRVAMLSYSTGGSGTGADVDKVRAATELVRERAPDLLVEGPIQYDAAVDPAVAAAKLPGSDRGRSRDRPDLPRPQHRQQHLQGGAAVRGCGGDRPGAPGSAQAGERPVPRGAHRRHRQHGRHHRHPGAAGRVEGGLMLVLVLNSGSSSLKYQLRDVGTGAALAGGICERIGGDSVLTHRTRIGRDAEQVVVVERPVADHAEALGLVDEVFEATGPVSEAGRLGAVGHRVVHGGERFSTPVVVDPSVLDAVRELVPLAPLHNPANLLGLEVALQQYPDVPSVAVFDTAFHQTLPPAAYTYAIDREVARAHGVRRYGFHGTSHAYVSRRAAAALGIASEESALITLHLGNGASACAVAGGRSVETSMGLTPLQGLVMGTRSGDIDPAVVFHLVRQAGMTADDVDTLLNSRSGLLGLCGDNDLRSVHARIEAGDQDAALALAVYVPPPPVLRRRLRRDPRSRGRRGVHRRGRRERLPGPGEGVRRTRGAGYRAGPGRQRRRPRPVRAGRRRGGVVAGPGARRADGRGAGDRHPGRRCRRGTRVARGGAGLGRARGCLVSGVQRGEVPDVGGGPVEPPADGRTRQGAAHDVGHRRVVPGNPAGCGIEAVPEGRADVGVVVDHGPRVGQLVGGRDQQVIGWQKGEVAQVVALALLPRRLVARRAWFGGPVGARVYQ